MQSKVLRLKLKVHLLRKKRKTGLFVKLSKINQ